MIRWMKGRVVATRDDGAILVFALIVVTAVALVVGTILTRGQGSLKATVALRSAAATPYAADAAANVVLNDLRTGAWLGTAPKTSPGWGYDNNAFDGCFGRDSVGAAGDTTPRSTVVLSNVYPATGTQSAPTSAYVDCEPEDATGQQGTPVAINDNNKPGNAILTLGTSGAEPGFMFKTNGSGGAFRVRGGVWSNSTVAQSQNGNLESTTYIKAHSGCSPFAAMSAPVVDCSAATVSDPNYGSDLDNGTNFSSLQLQTVPSTCSGGTVQLFQGIYDDVTNLNSLTPNGGGSCFIHFNPGTYYFDFHNNSADPEFQSNIAGNSGDVWNINSGTVVGGTLTTGTTIPGRCVSPIDSTTANGVQFIMGGDSRISVDKGAQVELCGTYHADRPPIVVYGQKTGTAAHTVGTDATALTTTGAPTVTNSDPANAGGFVASPGGGAVTSALLQDNGNGTALWQRTTAGGNSATSKIAMSGFKVGGDLPKGTVLTGATLNIRHRTTGTNAIVFTPTGGTAMASYNLPARTALGTEGVDLSLRTGWAAFQKSVHDNGYTGGTLAFTATLGKSQVSELDSARLILSYYTPQLRGETTTSIPSNTVATVAGEPVVKAQGNTTVFYTQGTTYIPNASLYLSLNNISESVFRFGVIARSLQVFETGSFLYTGAVIELPDNSPGWGTKSTLVQLKVYLCPGSSTCSDTTGTKALTVRAQIWDPTAVVSPPAREVNILSWSRSS